MIIKSQDAIAKKWASRAAQAAPDYTSGVQATTKSWSQNTTNAASSWEQGVQQAVANKRFANGVTKAGDSAWKNGALNKGSQRYAGGVNGAQAKFMSGFAPFASALASADLPPKFNRGNPQNQARSTFVQQLLRQTKVGQNA